MQSTLQTLNGDPSLREYLLAPLGEFERVVSNGVQLRKERLALVWRQWNVV